MNTICYIIAMQAEAQPLIDEFHLQEREGFFSPLPCRIWEGEVINSDSSKKLIVVLPGRQHDRDLIGCEPAAMTTTLAIERLHPDIIINSGTCGAWQRHGMKVGEVYLGSGAMFHDRHVPGDNAWDTQGLGNYTTWEGTEDLASSLGIKTAKVTTGSSFDMTQEEEQVIERNGGRLKEMEGAAVAFICSLYHVPVVLVKAVTNLRDSGNDDDMESFHQNLIKASKALLAINKEIISKI